MKAWSRCVAVVVEHATDWASSLAVRPPRSREINPVVMTADWFTSQAEKKEHFISRVVEEPKIFVMGDANDFTILAEHETDVVQVRRMLLAAQRSIDDVKNETINASHFECSGCSFRFI